MGFGEENQGKTNPQPPTPDPLKLEEKMDTPSDSTERYNHALGGFLGALIGDSVGSFLEFTTLPSQQMIDQALTMPGGGCWDLAPGQITDDGELTLCLARGLLHGGDDPLENIAGFYLDWLESPPFDIGQTTRNGLSGGLACSGSLARAMTRSAAQLNPDSKANGSLMRCIPLAIAGWDLEEDVLVSLARSESALTHPHPSCQDSVAAYVLAAAHLVANPGDSQGAWRRAGQWVRQSGCDEVWEWLETSLRDDPVPGRPHEGFVRIAFIHAFRHLQLETPYLDGLRQTLALGGDTDTNACIVGGMLGVLHGARMIPEPLQNAVLNCDPVAAGNPRARHRPQFLRPADLLQMVKKLLEIKIRV